jgi:hypothetical protein
LGGKAAKASALQKLIIDIVRQNPIIGLRELLDALRQRQGDGIIEEVDGEHIYFRPSGTAVMLEDCEAVEKKASSAAAPISGLKHRLTRARQKICNESQSR